MEEGERKGRDSMALFISTDCKYEQPSGNTFPGQPPSCNYEMEIWGTSGVLSVGKIAVVAPTEEKPVCPQAGAKQQSFRQCNQIKA